MTEQPQRTQLSPEEWKQLCLLNCQQLQNYLSAIPPMLEGGTPGLTAEHIAQIDAHAGRARTFLNAWARAKPVLPAQAAAPQPTAAATNGADPAPAKKRGGWPKGKKRNAPRADVQQ